MLTIQTFKMSNILKNVCARGFALDYYSKTASAHSEQLHSHKLNMPQEWSPITCLFSKTCFSFDLHRIRRYGNCHVHSVSVLMQLCYHWHTSVPINDLALALSVERKSSSSITPGTYNSFQLLSIPFFKSQTTLTH